MNSIFATVLGRKRRMGFGKRGKTSFTVHRSEEVLPGDVKLSKQGSSCSSDGEGSADGDRLLSYLIFKLQPSPSQPSKHDRYIERYEILISHFPLLKLNFQILLVVLDSIKCHFDSADLSGFRRLSWLR